MKNTIFLYIYLRRKKLLMAFLLQDRYHLFIYDETIIQFIQNCVQNCVHIQ
jgi:hypothetical protein